MTGRLSIPWQPATPSLPRGRRSYQPHGCPLCPRPLMNGIKGPPAFCGSRVPLRRRGRARSSLPRSPLGQTHLPLRLPVLRRRHPEMGRPLRDLRRVEHRRRKKPSSPAPAPPPKRRPAAPSPSSAWPAAPNRPPARRSASPNWIACWAAAWSPPRPCWSAATPASANPPCCCRPPPASRAPAGASCTSPARNPSTRSACAPAAWASPTPPIELAAAINVRDIVASLEQAKDTTLVVIELDPDHVAGHHRKRARHRRPGPRRSPSN